MNNSGFQFKQFVVKHSDVAMKVGTDSIMLGSWVDTHNAGRMLDVGTGCGLLALMLAQKTQNKDCDIVAIDIDAAAVKQAISNVAVSPWSSNIMVLHQSLQQYNGELFDLIISNPPYYPAGQLFDSQRQQARHQAQLNLDDLTTHTARLLTPKGRFVCIIPAQFESLLLTSAKQSCLNLSRRLAVKTTRSKSVSRVLLEFCRQSIEKVNDAQLIIHAAEGGYSAEYKQLCREFYLHF